MSNFLQVIEAGVQQMRTSCPAVLGHTITCSDDLPHMVVHCQMEGIMRVLFGSVGTGVVEHQETIRFVCVSYDALDL